MGYELDRTQLGGYDAVLDTTLFQEETLEMIVPDACPDILRIADTGGEALLRAREVMDGRVEVSGSIRSCVLYLPDGEEGMRHLDVTIPFSCAGEAEGIGPDCMAVVCVRLRRAEARMLNPRKVLIRAEAAVDVTVYRPKTEELCAQVLAEGGESVEQLVEPGTVYLTACVREKPFTLSEEIVLPASRGACAELLSSRAEVRVGESRLIGNKLIFKGSAQLFLLYRGEDDKVCTADEELPFSQIVEVSGVGEGADCELSLALTGLICELVGDGEGRTVSAELDVLAQAVAREGQNVEIVTDAYSVHEPLEAQREQHDLAQRLDVGARLQNVREAWETETAVRDVVESHLWLGQVERTWEGERLTLTAHAELSALCMGEDGSLFSVRREFSVPCTLEAAPGCRCLCRCGSEGEIYAAPAAGGLEVRFALEFRYTLLESRTVTVLSSLVPMEVPEPTGEQPSLVLKMLDQGQRLWDAAKAGGTTVADIMRANELTDEAAAAGKLLLIPRKR